MLGFSIFFCWRKQGLAFLIFIWASVASFAQVVINEVSSSNDITITDEFGETPDWLELWNNGSEPFDLSGYYLTDNPESLKKWEFPTVVIPENSSLLIFMSGREMGNGNLHASFKFSRAGEYVGLTTPQGVIMDETALPELYADVSFARWPNGSGEFKYCTLPTPGQENSGAEIIEQLEGPHFFFPNHFNTKGIELTIEGEGDIYFTRDGSIPKVTDEKYVGAIEIQKTTCIRARAFDSGKLSSETSNQTIFINESHELPVIALVSDPVNLYDEEEGILVEGPNADPEFPFYGANFWLDKSIPMDLSLYDEENNFQFQQKAKAEIHGGRGARTLPQKPLRLTATKIYGPELFNFPIFEYRGWTEYKHIVLRNSSGDWGAAHMRDGYLSRYIETEGLNIDVPGYRPCVVYLNGEFYGMMGIRDKLDEYFLNEKHGVDPNNVDFLERDSIALNGDFELFDETFAFAMQQDLSDQSSFDSVANLFEVAEITDYFILETALNNFDWPQNNIKYWRERKNGSLWRYVLFDLDGCCGRFPWSVAKWDNFGTRFNEYPENSLIRLMTALFENKAYRRNFLNRYADILNTSLRYESMMEETLAAADEIAPEMKDHFQLWSENNFANWQDKKVPKLLEFYEERPDFARQYLMEFFGLPGTVELSFDVFPPEAGTLVLNTISASLPWDGIYFNDIPVDVSVASNPGYTFSHWQIGRDGEEYIMDASFQKNFQTDQHLIAVFEEELIKEELLIYPNPTSASINYILPKGFQMASISLHDVLGRTVFYEENLVEEISTQDFNEGFYFLRAKDVNGVTISTVIQISK